MKSEQNPVLENIYLAREHAKLENYDASLKSFLNARMEIEQEIDNCKQPNEIQKWNAMLKDVKAEEAAVKRIKEVLDDILGKLDGNNNFYNFGGVEKNLDLDNNEEDEQIKAPLWSRPNDDGADDCVLKAAKGRPAAYQPKAKRQALPQPQARRCIPSRGGVNPSARGPHPPGRQSLTPGVKNKQANAKPIKVNAAAPPSSSGAAKDKTNLDPSTNPLVQQIIDMGILIREPNVQWESIAGLAQVKRLLRQNLVILPMRPDICKGLLAPWKSVLFYGPPGTGKTFLAKAVATECRRTFFNVTSATITSRFLGESEKLVSYLFDLADQMAPSTIFFDEIDSIASQRGTGNEHEASRRMKAQLLTKLEGIDGASDNSNIFVLAATNFPWHLDEALLRRFQKRIYIPLPDLESRLYLLKTQIADLIDDSFELELFAQKLEGYSCADIANLCRDAAQAVFDRQTSNLDTQEWLNMPVDQARVIISNRDFLTALSKRKSSVDPATLKKYEEWRLTKGAE